MWITKLKLKHADCPIVNRCQQFNLIVLSYPSTWYESKGKKFATTTCYFQSNDEKQKKKFIEDLGADRRISNLEVSGDVFTYEINLGKEGQHVMLYHTRQIIFVRPVVNHFDGHEYWEVASWKREELEKFIKELKSHMNVCEIMKMENSPLTDVYFPNVMPKLSKSQKEALEIAYQNGYYSYPRKITLKQLAKIAQIIPYVKEMPVAAVRMTQSAIINNPIYRIIMSTQKKGKIYEKMPSYNYSSAYT